MAKIIIKLFILVIVSSLISCKDYSYKGAPHLVLSVSDSTSLYFTSLTTSIEKVELYDGINWITLPSDPSYFDLMEQTGGTFQTIVDDDLDEGEYSHIRITFGSENYLTLSGSELTRTLKSDSSNLVWEKEIDYKATENKIDALDIDVDLNKAVVCDTINDVYSFVPKSGCRIIDANQNGAIAAVMTDESGSVITSIVQIKIKQQDSVLFTSYSNAENGRVFFRLPDDVYDLEFCPQLDEKYSSTKIEDVVVSGGEYLSLGKVELEHK